MKVTGQSSLIAAQALASQRSASDAKAASAAFFRNLDKAAPNKAPQTARTTDAPAGKTLSSQNEIRSQGAFLREAPLRSAQDRAPLAPGSLVNILV